MSEPSPAGPTSPADGEAPGGVANSAAGARAAVVDTGVIGTGGTGISDTGVGAPGSGDRGAPATEAPHHDTSDKDTSDKEPGREDPADKDPAGVVGAPAPGLAGVPELGAGPAGELRVLPLRGIGEVRPGDDLAALIAEAVLAGLGGAQGTGVIADTGAADGARAGTAEIAGLAEIVGPAGADGPPEGSPPAGRHLIPSCADLSGLPGSDTAAGTGTGTGTGLATAGDPTGPGHGAPARAGVSLLDGDVLVVTSKIISKAEGRLIQVDGDREAVRQAAIEAESVREVARRGPTRIVETRHGFVLASAGVDASNIAKDSIALLPVDPDASARALRDGLRARLGVDVAVIVSDTAGRPWRRGLTDLAIGVAGMAALRSHVGDVDAYGNELGMTEIAEADELAAAADLVKGKLGATPVAVVRGFTRLPDDGAGVRTLLRPAAEDMFRLGTTEALRAAPFVRRTVREFADLPVDPAAVRRAVAAAITAPAPHHTTPWRFVLVSARRDALLDAMALAWAEDLRRDGFDAGSVNQRLRRGDVLRRAPVLIVPLMVTDGAHPYPDERRARAEERMFTVAMGAGVQNLLIGLAAEGLGSCWVSSALFCGEVVTETLDLPREWIPMGVVGAGHPAAPARPRPARDVDAFLLKR